MNRLHTLLAALLLVLTTQTKSIQDTTTIAGVVEQTGNRTAVRVLFRHTAGHWEPFTIPCNNKACLHASAALYPNQTRWSLFRNGRELERVVAKTPASFSRYIDQGLQQISFPNQMLLAGTLTSTVTNLRDPDHWRQSPPNFKRVKTAFRSNFTTVRNCAQTGEEPAKAQPWNYPDTAIRLQSSLASQRGWRLAQAVLTGYRCDGVIPEDFSPQWFAISPSNEVSRLNTTGMQFVGAGDLDGDGSSELVFTDNQDNGVLYKLFSAEMKELVSLHFAAH